MDPRGQLLPLIEFDLINYASFIKKKYIYLRLAY